MGGNGEKHKEINKWAEARTNYRLRMGSERGCI